MREMRLESWDVVLPDGKKGAESLLTVLSGLLRMKDPQTMPRGLELFRTMGRISKAFDAAQNNGMILKLEESEYSFLKKEIETNIPSTWGLNANALKAVESFIEAKEVD